MADDLDDFIEGEFSPPVDEPVEPLAQEELTKLDESVAIPASLMAGDEETPPEPPFLIHRNKFGPGAHGVYFPDGTPVGAWMREANLTPEAVVEILTAKGLPDDLVEEFRRQRAGGIEADRLLSGHPVVIANQARLDEHNAQTEHLRAAFIKAKKEKG